MTVHEAERNELLRRVDWRFLVRHSRRPRAFSRARGRLGQAVPLVADAASPGQTDLVVLQAPNRPALVRAHAALSAGGELYCEWRLPRPGGAWMARRVLALAGFVDIRIHWPGPHSGRTAPQFWLPLDSTPAVQQLLAERSPANLGGNALHWMWRFAARSGTLAPLCVLARRPLASVDPGGAADEVDSVIDGLSDEGDLAGPRSWLLLTAGARSINKVVGIPFGDRDRSPDVAVKFARVSDAEPGLRREAHVLRALEREHPSLPGIPRVLGTGRRAGELAVVQSAVQGAPLMSALTPATFPRLAADVTLWLVELARAREPEAPSRWWHRLVERPLEQFEHEFGPAVGAGMVSRARDRLTEIGALPIVCEHRDCSPWNVIVTSSGAPAVLDWESAEPRGLPVVDLVYFLATSVFVLEGALETGLTHEAYARLLDPATGWGRVAADCLGEYCQRLGLDPGIVFHLRLLTWIVHSRSDFRHFELDSGTRPTPGSLRQSVFVGLVREELARSQSHA